MKKILSILTVITMLMFPFDTGAAEIGDNELQSLFLACETVFDASSAEGGLEGWGWSAQFPTGMSVADADGMRVVQFTKTDGYNEGGNLTLSEDITAATGKASCDFAVIEFLTYFSGSAGEHIYTFYGSSTNTSGKEILKFKYKNGSLYPCTAADQNADSYSSSAIASGNGVPVRVFFVRDGDKLQYIYQVNSSGWHTAYQGETTADRLDSGIGTIRCFVKYGELNAPTGFGELKIYAGKKGDSGKKQPRYMESLGRGLAAMKTDEGIYLSWRLLGTEEYSASFEIYRDGKNIALVDDSTNYIDRDGSTDSVYSVAAQGDEPCEGVKAFSSMGNYFDIPLSKPENVNLPDGGTAEYTPWDASCGDLDGDGEYEIIQRWDGERHHAGNGGYTGGIILDAYKTDGTVLWRIDLGKNIRCNTEQGFLVYDLNCDGIAEIAAKTAPGSKDGLGNYVTEASLIDSIRTADNSADYRNDNGTVLDGPEYYTLFDGRNGKALDTVYYPKPRGEGDDFYVWGDNYGHRSEKYFDTAAYLDGIHPYIVLWRGIYSGQSKYGPGRTGAAAFSVTSGNRLRLEYTFDTMEGQSGYTPGNEEYIGQGNHNISVGDVDGDGLDEIISGNLCLDNDLSALWCSGRGHGDAQHLGNYDPTTEGLEYMTVHENAPYGMTVYNAKTGDELLHKDGSGDTGRGVMANVGSGGYYQVWGAGTYQSDGGGSFSETKLSGQSYNYRIFWDGDTYDELLDAVNSTSNHTPVVTSYNPETGAMEEIFRAYDTETINSTKSTVALQADIIGDWREEIIAVTDDMSALRVYISDIYTTNKVYTLMHDSQYRQSIAWQNEYYKQPPHIGFYLSGTNNEYDERSKKPNIITPQYQPTEFEEPIKIPSGTLKEKKVQNSENIIDLDGDYYHSFDLICGRGSIAKIGETTISVTGKSYASLSAANERHSSVMLCGGFKAKDGRFLSFGSTGDPEAAMTISGERAVTKTGTLHFDFAVPAHYSHNGSADRTGNNVSLKIGSSVVIDYIWETMELKVNDLTVYTYQSREDAQKWTAVDADISCTDGSLSLRLTFPDGSEKVIGCDISKNAIINEISATLTSGQWDWGCVLLDNITLYSQEPETIWISTGGFTPHSFDKVTGDFSIEADITAYEKTDGVIGLTASGVTPTWYDKFNIVMRLTTSGTMEAYDQSGWASINRISYNIGEDYHIEITGNTVQKKYSIYVTDSKGVRMTLAESYGYRQSAPDAADLGSVCVLGGDGVGGGKFALKNFKVNVPLSANLEGNVLKITTRDDLNVYAAFYENGFLKKVYVDEVEIEPEASCDRIKVMWWDNMAPAREAEVISR